jgi:hypothetical protein
MVADMSMRKHADIPALRIDETKYMVRAPMTILYSLVF